MPRFASTKTPLGNAGTASFDLTVGRDDYIVGMIFSDQAGTLFIEQSIDGINYDLSTSYLVVANDGKGFKEDLMGPYARIRYVNGATPQGAFRLYARLSSAGDS